MAGRKQVTDPVGGGGEKHGTIEIAYMKLSGNDTTLQKAVDAFTTLIKAQAGNGHVLTAPKRVNTLPPVQGKNSNGDGTEAATSEEEPIDIEASESDETEAPAAAAIPKAPRKYAKPTAIAIETLTAPSVDDFVKPYKLDSNEEKYLALAAWMKAHHQGTPLKAGHIVTLFNHFDWTLPADITMPFRKMVSKNMQWLERVGSGDYQIHQIGEGKLAKLKV